MFLGYLPPLLSSFLSPVDIAAAVHFETVSLMMARAYDTREYELTVRQEPKQARMCGVGGKGAAVSPACPVYRELTLVFFGTQPTVGL